MNPEWQAHSELARLPAEPPGLVPGAQPSRTPAVPRAGQAGPPEAQASALTPMALARALRRRAAVALGVALLATGIAGPATWFLVPASTFKAQARLHVNSRPPKIIFQTVDTQGGSDDYGRYQSTQQTLIRSRLVLSAALRDPHIARYRLIREQDDPIAWLQEKLSVQFVAGSEVMEISLMGNDPEEVAGIVNAVKKAYMDEVVYVDLKRRTERFDQLKKIKESYGEMLDRKKDTMRKLAESVGSDDKKTAELRQQHADNHKSYLQSELLEVNSRRRKLEIELKLQQRDGEAGQPAAEPAPPSEREIDQLVEEHPAVAELVELLAKQQQQYNAEWANVRRVSRNPAAEPSLKILRDQWRSTRRLLDEQRAKVRPEVIRQARRQGAVEDGARGRELARELAAVSELAQRLEDEIKSIEKVSKALTNNVLDLASNKAEVEQIDLAYTKVAQEVEALNVELEAPPRIRLIDDATVPRGRDEKKRYMMVGMVSLGSFFGGLFGVAFLELQTRKVDTAEEVPVELGLPVVGALPILPARNYQRGAIARRESEKDRHWRNVLLESVDTTRTLLLHAARTGSYRTMMITSAVGGEGKTSLASYLATSLARSGLRTLLVDADLRRPMMHGLFDQPPSPGLSELLRSEVELDDAMGATAVPNLTLLVAGRCDRQALRMLSQGGIAPLFDRLKQRFDFIIVDSSPILPVADAMLIAQHVDAAIFSIFRDVSRKAKVRAAFDRLRCLGVPVLGAVVTGGHDGTYGNSYTNSYATYPSVPESVDVPSNQSS
jgi:polysaccharide biosynthesis transport protein